MFDIAVSDYQVASATLAGAPDAVVASDDSREAELKPEQVFFAAENLAAKGDFDGAITLLSALTSDPNHDYRAEARVRLARIFIAKGEFRTALTWFQRLLDEKPNAGGVRVEMARLLLQLGNEKAAANQLRRAASTPNLSESAKKTLRQASANFQNNAPFSGNLQLGIAPDSNINRATNAQQVDFFGLPFVLNDDGRAQSGVGLTINGSGTIRRKIDDNSRLLAQIAVDANLYRETEFADIAATAIIGPEIRNGKSTFRPSVIGGKRWLGFKPLYNLYGLSVLLERQLTSRSQITATGSILRLDYTARPDLTGPTYTAGISYDRAITPRLSARIGVNAARNDANAAANATKTIGGDILLSRDAGRFTLYGKFGLSHTQGDAPFEAFGGTRRDYLYDGEAGIIFRQINALGLSPSIRYKHAQNDSNLTLFQFKRNRFEFALAKAF